MTLWTYLTETVCGTVSAAVLLVAGVWFACSLRGFAYLRPLATVRALLKRSRGADGSPFRALCVALAGTLGVGNIAGVALAIATGGAGSLFWMWVCALLVSFLKYAEITLAMRYKQAEPHLPTHGAVRYIADLPGRLGRWGGGVFAASTVLVSLTLGGTVQGGAIAAVAEETLSVSPLAVGVVLLALTAWVVMGGAGRVISLASRWIPLLSVLYVGMCLWVVCLNLHGLPAVLAEVMRDAFSADSVGGGVLGFVSVRALRVGCTRGLFSNEAGCGTAPSAHATAEVDLPARQGLLGIVEVLVDTVVFCTLTGLVLLLSLDRVEETGGGMEAVRRAFSLWFGRVGEWALLFFVFAFAFATVACWSFYGREALDYFRPKKTGRTVYQTAFCLSVSVGCLLVSPVAWQVTDVLLCLMTVLNVTALCRHRRAVVEETGRLGLMPTPADGSGAPRRRVRPPCLSRREDP